VNDTDEGGSGQLLPHSTMVLVPQRRSMPLVSGDEVQALLLLNVQSSQGGAVWLHYETTYSSSSEPKSVQLRFAI
jgi:hypothetical protein